MLKSWFKVALFNLLIVAIIGALLRFAFVEEITWLRFQHWLHGHSHLAMLGWVYLGLFTLLTHSFLSSEKRNTKYYNWLFWLTQGSAIGMLIAFPLQGYGIWSISFSTIHILLSYVFVNKFWKDISEKPSSKKQLTVAQKLGELKDDSSENFNPSIRFTKASLFFMVLSTIAIWGMIPINISGKAGSAMYYGAVQFYLHFQFNGWFIFAVLALFFKLLESNGLQLPIKTTKIFFRLLVISCFLTFALAITWSTPLPFLFLINSLGVIFQLGALIAFLLIIKEIRKDLKSIFHTWVKTLFGVSFLAFVLKILIQAAVVIPYIATVGYTIRNFVIGFLHLMLLGIITSFILGLGIQKGLFTLQSKWAKLGMSLFLLGFGLSELILFLQGTMFWGNMGFLPQYYELLFVVSALLPLGIGFVFFAQFQNSKR